MITMGMVGLVRIMKEEVEMTDFGVNIDKEILEKLPKNFFDYMVNQYDVAERDYERLKNYFSYAGNKKYFKQNMTNIRNLMKGQLDKIKKYFPEEEATQNIQKTLEQVKKIKDFDQVSEVSELIEDYYKNAKLEKINDKLTTNFFKTSVLRPLYGQPSFLNVAKNKLTKEEQINEFYKDYVQPAILELELLDRLEKEEDAENIKQFLRDNNDYPPFKQILKVVKKKDLEGVNNYIKNELPKCTFIDELFATGNYEEMIFSPLGISSLNFSWNLNRNQPVPISALAKLILFLAPAGAAFYYRREGHVNQRESRLYAGFVMSNDPFQEIYRQNNHFQKLKKEGNPFDEVIVDLLQETKERAKKVVKQLFFIEFYAEYESKKTLLDYYHMPLYVAKYFSEYGDKLSYIGGRNYREEFTRAVLSGINPKNIVYKYLREVIENNYSAIGVYIAARELNRIQSLKKGVSDMKKEDKKVFVVFKQGQELRNRLIQVSQGSGGVEDEQGTGGDKKINALAYRLLNSSKAGNKKGFMDTIFRIHMNTGKEVSPIFLNALHEEELSFETIASAFIAGMLSPERENEKEAVTNE